MSASAATTSAPTARENPYEYWIEPSEIEKCEILFSFNATYSVNNEKTVDVIEEIWAPAIGKFNNATKTFKGSYAEERNDDKYSIDTKCEIYFDPGVNQVIGFKMSGTESGGNCKTNFKVDATNQECFIPRSHFCNLKLDNPEIVPPLSEEEINLIEQAYKKISFFGMHGTEICDRCIKSLEVNAACEKDKKTKRTKLTDYECGAYSFINIKFAGCLPELPAYEGKCSWFGGKNDTGVDKVLREEFYEKHVGEYTPADFTYEEFYKNKKAREEFNKWMNDRAAFFGNWKDAGWEGTGLDCGPARNLDTENDYFCAMRWQQPYADKGKLGYQHWWREQKVKVTNPATNKSVLVRPVDWGPHEKKTGRTIDLSNKSLNDIGAETDDWLKICWADQNAPLGLC